jgi:hypothetical protein
MNRYQDKKASFENRVGAGSPFGLLSGSPKHPFVRLERPSLRPDLPSLGKAALGGQGRPQAAAQRREASLRAERRLAMLGADRGSGEV